MIELNIEQLKRNVEAVKKLRDSAQQLSDSAIEFNASTHALLKRQLDELKSKGTVAAYKQVADVFQKFYLSAQKSFQDEITGSIAQIEQHPKRKVHVLRLLGHSVVTVTDAYVELNEHITNLLEFANEKLSKTPSNQTKKINKREAIINQYQQTITSIFSNLVKQLGQLDSELGTDYGSKLEISILNGYATPSRDDSDDEVMMVVTPTPIKSAAAKEMQEFQNKSSVKPLAVSTADIISETSTAAAEVVATETSAYLKAINSATREYLGWSKDNKSKLKRSIRHHHGKHGRTVAENLRDRAQDIQNSDVSNADKLKQTKILLVDHLIRKKARVNPSSLDTKLIKDLAQNMPFFKDGADPKGKKSARKKARDEVVTKLIAW